MRFARFGIASLTAPLLIWLTSGSALAAPPSNDLFTGATAVSIGFSEVLDTTQATTDADDAQLNSTCAGHPFEKTDNSVWYVIQGTDHDVDVAVNVLGSNYTVGVLVGTGSQGNLQGVTCGIGIVPFTVAAGTTYYVLVIDDQFDGSGNGGLLGISFTEVPPPPPPPTLDINVNRSGTVNVLTGIATVSGTYTCSNSDPDFLQGRPEWIGSRWVGREQRDQEEVGNFGPG